MTLVPRAWSPVDLPAEGDHIRGMSYDISHLLDQWDYEPGRVVVRRFTGQDGQEKIQLRVDLGLLQMNVQGRPDGKRPLGHRSLYDFFTKRLQQHRRQHKGDEADFALVGEDCAKLQLEALQYHHRSICLLELQDFAAAAQDTERNLNVLDFVEEYADSDELAWALQQFRPQILMLHIRARATQLLQSNQFVQAIEEIESGLEQLRDFYQEHGRQEMVEHSPEFVSLQQWAEEIHKRRPLSKRERLEQDLEEAVQREDYEKAARVRDALRRLSD